MVENPVQKDAQAVLDDVADAWSELPDGQRIPHEVHCFPEGAPRRGQPRQVEVRFESLSERQQDDVREKLEAWAHNLARGARARNTVDALRRDLKLFVPWCRNTARVPLPATQETLCAFLRAHADSRKVSTLRRYLASVATLHSAAGLSNPTIGELVRSELDLIARNQAAADKAARAAGEPVRFAKRQAAPLRDEDLVKADALFEDSMRGIRDRAIVWMAFDTLMRSSELAAMRVEDLREASAGAMIVTLPHSKSDQYGDGQKRYVSPWTAERLKAWLQVAHTSEGYVFRGIDTRFAEGGRGKGNKKTLEHVREAASRQVIYRAIKNCAARLYGAGFVQFDIGAYSAHSTRVGAAQDMLAEGVSMLAVQQAGGWKTDVMPMQYAKEIDALHGGAAQLAQKRGRTTADPEDGAS